MSSSDSSRARITRVAPSSRASSTDAASVHVICVEAWIGSSGAMARTSRATPRSCTMTASTPASAQARTAASTRGELVVEHERVERDVAARAVLVQAAHACAPSSAASKFVARARALKPWSPKYTASAPARTAAWSDASSPAGASTSGLFCGMGRGSIARPACGRRGDGR